MNVCHGYLQCKMHLTHLMDNSPSSRWIICFIQEQTIKKICLGSKHARRFVVKPQVCDWELRWSHGGIYRQSGVILRNNRQRMVQKEALLTLRSLELQAEKARTKNTRTSAHQVPNRRAEAETVSLGKEHFPPVALKQHSFVSWKHL